MILRPVPVSDDGGIQLCAASGDMEGQQRRRSATGHSRLAVPSPVARPAIGKLNPSFASRHGEAIPVRSGRAGLEAGYGLGLNRHDRHGVIGRCHVGTTVGHRANLCLFPEENKAFFVSMNADVETADYERFDALLIRALGVRPADPATPADPSVEIADWQGIYVLSPNRTESFVSRPRAQFRHGALGWGATPSEVVPGGSQVAHPDRWRAAAVE